MADPAPDRADGRRSLFGIRAKVIIVLLLTAVPIIAGFGWHGLKTITELMRQQAVTALTEQTRDQARWLEEAVGYAASDAVFLAQSECVLQFARACRRPDGPPGEVVAGTQRELVTLADAKGLYARVAIWDAAGSERVRVETRPGGAVATPLAGLQSAPEQVDVAQALALGTGDVYVSPLGLDRQAAAAGPPYEPVIRFASAVPGSEGPLGVLVLHLDAGPFLPSGAYEGGDTYVVDPAGWYLSHTDPSKAWSGPTNLDSSHRLEADLGQLASVVLRPGIGPPVVQSGMKLIARHPVILSPGFPPNFVVLCAEAREQSLFGSVSEFSRWFWAAIVISFVAPVLAGLGLATYFLRPLRKLRGGVHALAEGDLGSRVEVTSGDEFQQLADDFNLMADRLQDYQRGERMALVGRMARTLIHDIKNPLSSVTVFARLLGDSKLSEDERRQAADRAVEQVKRIHQMLQEILDFSRGEGGRIEQRSMTFNELFSELRPAIEAQCADLDIALQMASDVNCTLLADKAQLERAISNLTSNACEAMPDGGTLTVRSACDERGVTIEVQDTGPGLPEGGLERLVEPFVTYGKPNGTGLGLAITKTIVEAHGGTLDAEDRPGGGATFRIWLPLVEPDQAPGGGYAI